MGRPSRRAGFAELMPSQGGHFDPFAAAWHLPPEISRPPRPSPARRQYRPPPERVLWSDLAAYDWKADAHFAAGLRRGRVVYEIARARVSPASRVPTWQRGNVGTYRRPDRNDSLSPRPSRHHRGGVAASISVRPQGRSRLGRTFKPIGYAARFSFLLPGPPTRLTVFAPDPALESLD